MTSIVVPERAPARARDAAAAPRFAPAAGIAAAATMAIASLIGILSPAAYAQESPGWTGQALGQDWIDLVVGVPALVIAAVGARRGSRAATLALAGGFVYTLYTFVLYAFAVHFNRAFLVYCATLGLSFYGLAALVPVLADGDARGWLRAGAPRRLAGGILAGTGALFALMWLAEVVPAVASGTTPATITEIGLFTNPVQVIDLSVILPALMIGGVGLARGTMPGVVMGPALLVFSVLMSASIGGMMVVMRAYGYPASMAVAGGMLALSAGTAAITVWLFRYLRR